MERDVSTGASVGPTPDPDYRARFREKFWPLAAVLAWIIWRSPDSVQQCWSGSIRAIRARHKDDASGPDPDQALRQLLSELRHGSIYSSGKRDGATKREHLTAEQWSVLSFATNVHGKDCVIDEELVPEEGDAHDLWNTIEQNEEKRLSGLVVRYDALRFSQDSVLKAFPLELQTAPVVHEPVAVDGGIEAKAGAEASTPETPPVTQSKVTPAARPQRRRGPPPYDDVPLLDEMHSLIQSNTARSITGAAMMVVARAKGGGIDESRRRRLCRRYSKRHPPL
jgi:hypothetical protein